MTVVGWTQSYSTGKDAIHRRALKTNGLVLLPLCSGHPTMAMVLRKPAPAIEPNALRRDPRQDWNSLAMQSQRR